MYSVLGKKVIESKISNDILNISNLVNGIYLLHINTNQGAIVKKIVKQ